MRAGLYRAELSRVMFVVPSARVERACLAALVSETSASSNFATRGMSWCLMQASNLHAAWPRFLRPLRLPIPPIRPDMGRPVGLEPTTARITTGSATAAPWPPLNLVGTAGLEPATFCTPCRRATRLRYAPKVWSPRPASIRRPPDPKSGALPGCATRRNEMNIGGWRGEI